jgi:hypothetical protein
MPGPYTHIYTARRVTDLLRKDVVDEIVRLADADVGTGQDPRSGSYGRVWAWPMC